MFHSSYMGCLIYRNTGVTNKLRWYAIGVGAADTLEGIRELVREKYGSKIKS